MKSGIIDFIAIFHNTLSLSSFQKGEKNDIRHIKDDNNMYQQCLYIYDIVYFNGQVLTNLPLKERILKIKEVIPQEIPGKYLTILGRSLTTGREGPGPPSFWLRL